MNLPAREQGVSGASPVSGVESAAGQPSPVRIYGRYEILGEIARGGMGIVYLARLSGEGGFSRLFGLKVMHPHLAEQDGFARLMMREAKLAASIHHPNVVGTVDFGMHDGSYFMVLDYIEGMALGNALKAQPDTPARLVVLPVIDALQGLHAAHTLMDYDGQAVPIVHQDVSPDNILVGIDGIGRITDFGIAREVQQTTYAGNPKGKASYMSPEQLTGRRVDVRADLWSMGVVLWNVLTGERLFTAPTAAATIYNVLHQEIPLPSTVGRMPPPEFDEVVMRALSREQDDRFTSAAEMAQALEEAAKKIGAPATRTEVGKWIQVANPEEVKRRRDMVKRAGAPSISITLSGSTPVGIAMAGTPHMGISTGDPTVADPAMIGQLTSGTVHTGQVAMAPGFPRSIALASIILSMSVAAWVALREPLTTPAAAASGPPKGKQVTVQPVPVVKPAVQPPSAPPQAGEPSALVEANPAVPAAPATPGRGDKPKAKPSRKPTVAPHSVTSSQPSQPQPKPVVQMEANPYLRQE